MISELEKDFFSKTKWLPISDFTLHSAILKQIVRFQMSIDKKFGMMIYELRGKMYDGKLSPPKFWEQYKKLLMKSVSQDKKLVQELLKRMDKKMKEICKLAEKAQKAKGGKPLVDLSLPK